MKAKNVHPSTYKKVADRIAQASGYKDHADALAHRDPNTGKVEKKEDTVKVDKFNRGSGCYTCAMCGKQTRETGGCESNCRLCLSCFEQAGLENEHQDGHHGDPNPDCPMCKVRKVGWPQDQILDEGDVDRVKLLYNCPDCGENRLSHLHRGEDDASVDCASCGTVYVPEFEAEKQLKEAAEILDKGKAPTKVHLDTGYGAGCGKKKDGLAMTKDADQVTCLRCRDRISRRQYEAQRYEAQKRHHESIADPWAMIDRQQALIRTAAHIMDRVGSQDLEPNIEYAAFYLAPALHMSEEEVKVSLRQNMK